MSATLQDPGDVVDRRSRVRLVIDERTLAEVLEEAPPASDVGWFVARQPAILFYLESNLGRGTDALVIALDAAWRVHTTLDRQLGRSPARVKPGELELAEARVVDPDSGAAALHQPAVCRWITRLLGQTPVTLPWQDARRVAVCLTVVVEALLSSSL